MTWLQPWAVWFLAGVPVIVALYFLRLKRRRATVSTLMFWQRITQQSSRSALFQRLRNVLSLLLQLLILLLLIGALARPTLDRLTGTGASTVIILDGRARMQALEPDGRTRFARALGIARDYARQAGAQLHFALITLGARPAVAVPFTTDERPLRRALDTAGPTDAAGSLDDALELADSLLAARTGARRIVVITDRAGASGPIRTIPRITHAVGSPLENLAITRFATRPMPASPETAEVLLEVRNFGTSPARTEIELAFDGRPLEVKPFTLAAGEKRTEIFNSVPRPARSARGWLTAKLAVNDALALDDVAFASLPPARPDRILLVSNGNAFLEKFLAVDSGVKFQFVTADAYQPGMAEKFEAVIFDGALPPAFDLGSATGNFLFLRATPFAGGGPPIDQPLVTDVDAIHPATRLVSLQNVTIMRAESLLLPPSRDGWKFSAPLRSFANPLLITGERGGQRVAALAFDVLQSDLPLRIAFPLLMNSTLRWLAGERASSPPSISAGGTLALSAGQIVAAAPLTALPRPGDKANAPSVTEVFEPVRNGFYELNDNGVTRWIAVNTFSATESDLRIPPRGEISSAASGGTSIVQGRPLWQWLALAAFILITAEWWLFHRRKTE